MEKNPSENQGCVSCVSQTTLPRKAVRLYLFIGERVTVMTKKVKVCSGCGRVYTEEGKEIRVRDGGTKIKKIYFRGNNLLLAASPKAKKRRRIELIDNELRVPAGLWGIIDQIYFTK